MGSSCVSLIETCRRMYTAYWLETHTSWKIGHTGLKGSKDRDTCNADRTAFIAYFTKDTTGNRENLKSVKRYQKYNRTCYILHLKFMEYPPKSTKRPAFLSCHGYKENWLVFYIIFTKAFKEPEICYLGPVSISLSPRLKSNVTCVNISDGHNAFSRAKIIGFSTD